MKKFIVCLSAILVLTSLFSISFAKTFSDVKGTNYEKSVGILSDLGVVDGYQDGTYKPKNTVTRAELAKLIIVSLGKQSVADSLKGSTNFPDVVANSWASGYINYANQTGIIKGYPDGTFKPNDSVSYVEASTMLLRSLNYTKELESEKYPTGYMQKANDAGILKNVTAGSSSEAAIRGNIANMVLNTLMANTRKIVSTTSDGKANYGDSTPLIETAFKDYSCVKNGEVIDIDFASKEVTVKDSANNKKVSIVVNDKALEELYGRKVDFLYKDEDESLLVFDIIDGYKVTEVNVAKIEDDTIYDDKDKKYDIPSKVVLQYIYNYDEVETAYILYDGTKILSMVLTGTPKVYAGMVVETGIKVSGVKGFEIQKPDGKYKEYALSDQSEKAVEDNAILYSLDNDDAAVILYKFALKNAVNIEELTSTSITLKKEKEISLTSEIEHYVYLIDTELNIREGKLKDIEEEFDKAETFEYADVWYIVVFEDSVDDDEIVSKLSVAEAKELLEDEIKLSAKLIKKETSYSVATFEAFKAAYNAGNAALKTSSSAAKMELCQRKLQDARKALKTATSSDKQLRNDFADLQDIITEAEGKKSADYTAASFKVLTDELKTAKAIKIENTTSSKISDAISALRKAINMLVTNTANTEIQNAIKNLNELISRGDEISRSGSMDYTTDSYNDFLSALNTAKKFNSSNASLSEIKNQASNLEAAIDALVPIYLENYKTAKNSLDETYNDAKSRKASNYTKESFDMFQEQFEELEDEYKDVPTIKEIENYTNAGIQKEITKVNNLNTAIKNALKVLVSITDDTARQNLRKLIAKGEEYTQDTWDGTISFAELRTKLNSAKQIVNDQSKTEAEVLAAFMDLAKYISL